jgi:ethanolamine ammonia-lyase small subunit
VRPPGPHDPLDRDGGPLAALRRFTPARIGLGRVGVSLPTRHLLALGLAAARARDAVQAGLEVDRLRADLSTAGSGQVVAGSAGVAVVKSAAPDRATYLVRPDLGRRLAEGEGARLAALAGRSWPDGGPAQGIAVVAADGLSALAAQRHAGPLLAALRARAPERWGAAPVVVALQGRVALGDEIGAALGARLVVVLIGERPGSSACDSLGVYLTYGPRPGRSDAERNCVSNVRPEGLGYAEAARRIDWLAAEALARGLTGVALKDGSGAADAEGRLVEAPRPPRLT